MEHRCAAASLWLVRDDYGEALRLLGEKADQEAVLDATEWFDETLDQMIRAETALTKAIEARHAAL